MRIEISVHSEPQEPLIFACTLFSFEEFDTKNPFYLEFLDLLSFQALVQKCSKIDAYPDHPLEAKTGRFLEELDLHTWQSWSKHQS